jgi:aminoglycoside 6'-N-acetyltransferase
MDTVCYGSLSFRPLRERDLPTLYSWRQEPHVREFVQRQPPAWEEIRDKYLPRLNPDWPAKCFLSCVGSPIGYIQTYRIADWPEYATTIDEPAGIGVDLFIGDAGYVGKGWGRMILLKFLNDVAFPMFPAEEVCWIMHDKMNRRALRASRAAGFC